MSFSPEIPSPSSTIQSRDPQSPLSPSSPSTFSSISQSLFRSLRSSGPPAPRPSSLRSTASASSSLSTPSNTVPGLLLLRTASLIDSVRGTSDLLPNPLAGLLKPATYTCQICYSSLQKSDTSYQPYVLSNCGHCFCKDCLAGYVSNEVNEGQVTLTCFYRTDDGVGGEVVCGASLAERDVRGILDVNSSNRGGKEEEVYRKYERFKFDRDNVDSRRCPKCDEAIINKSGRRKEDGRIVNPEMVCGSCKTEFCFYHSNSHPGKTCSEYESMNSIENKLNEEYLAKFSKPCPQCKVLVQKSGGCNQMKCTKCGVHFCWLCNQQVDGGTFPSHFQWWNVNGCPNMQMNESIEPSKAEIGRSRALAILQIVLLGPPSAVLTVASSIVCCCCLPAMGDDSSERFESCMSLWGNLLSVLVMIPFILVGLALVPVWCIFFTLFECLRIYLFGIKETDNLEEKDSLTEDEVFIQMEEGKYE